MSENLHEALDNLQPSVQAIEDLVSVVGMLKLICRPTVNVSTSAIFQPLQPDTQPGGEAIAAPEPFQELELQPQFEADRKCFMANRLIDDLATFFDAAYDVKLDQIEPGATSIGESLAQWSALIGTTLNRGSVIIAETLATVAARLTGAIEAWNGGLGSINADSIATAIQNRRDDLVCALFEADTVAAARNGILAILANEGINAENQNWVAAVLSDFCLNYLFYQFSEQVEVAYQIATGYDCTSCNSGVCDNREGSTTTVLIDDGDTYRLQAGQSGADPAYYASITFDATEAYQLCQGTVTISSCQLISGSLTGYGSYQVRFYDIPPTPNSVGNRYHSANLPTTDITGVRVVVFKSSAPFTVEFDWEAE